MDVAGWIARSRELRRTLRREELTALEANWGRRTPCSETSVSPSKDGGRRLPSASVMPQFLKTSFFISLMAKPNPILYITVSFLYNPPSVAVHAAAEMLMYSALGNFPDSLEHYVTYSMCTISLC